MYAGIAIAIQVERVPLSRRIFGVALLNTMPALFAFLAKSQECSTWIINIICFRFFVCWYICLSTRTAPIIAGIPFFYLKFLCTHPGAIICPVFSNGMIQ